MSEKRMNGPTLVFVITLISVLNFGNFCLAQQKEKKRYRHDSCRLKSGIRVIVLSKIWANYPAISSHFPLKLFSRDLGLPPGL